MRRYWVVALAVLTLLGVLSPPALAQAPAPKVTITGLIDTVTRITKNFEDEAFHGQDNAWVARNRGVFTITGEVGKAKGVLALEIDLGWGQTGLNESTVAHSGQTITSNASSFGGLQAANTQAGMDLGVDTAGVIEIKNLYVEVPVPLIPFPTVARLGAQPFQVTYKVGVLATTDYGGVWLSSTLAPWLKLNFTYAQVEEDVIGANSASAAGVATGTQFFRGDDFFLAVTPDITVVKGLDVRPIYSLFYAVGNTATLARCRIRCAGQPSNGAGVVFNNATGTLVSGATAGAFGNNLTDQGTFEEYRHTFGIDTRWTFGPWYLDPTFLVQLGTYDVLKGPGAGAGNRLTVGKRQGDYSAMLVDVRGGYRTGPLFVQGYGMFASGTSARDNMFNENHTYHPVNGDAAYLAGWTELLSFGLDYFVGGNTAHGLGENIGLGRSGRIQFGFWPTYTVTPEFDVYGRAHAAWTHKAVDTDAIATSKTASYATAPCVSNSAGCGGDSRYIGAELDLGITYRFAPGLTFDLVGGWLFAGSALDTTLVRNGVIVKEDAHDAQILSARLRYTF